MESVSQEFLVQRLPLLMDTVLHAIVTKKIICSSSREILLNYLGNLSRTLSAEQLKTKFKCEDSFLLHCIKVVTHGYICWVLANINSMIDDKTALHSIEHYKSLFSYCKAEAANIQIRHRYQEMYLGKPLFCNEHSRSLDEFVKIVIKALGFCPYKFDEGRPSLSAI